MLECLEGHPGVEGALGRKAAQFTDQFFKGEALVGAVPHQSPVEIGSTGDGGHTAGAVEGEVLHDSLGIELQLQVKVVAVILAPDPALMGGGGQVAKPPGRFKVVAGLRGEHSMATRACSRRTG